jgi:hypothetical protein
MKMTFLRFSSALLLFLACVALCACKPRKKPAGSDSAKAPLPFSQVDFKEITPLLDGSAYALSRDSRLWYLSGNRAVLVSVQGSAAKSLPRLFELVPVLDGGAYAIAWKSEDGLWYLKGERAERVTEAPSFALTTNHLNPAGKAFYVLYLAEQKKRKEAEYRADHPEEYYDAPLPGDEYGFR